MRKLFLIITSGLFLIIAILLLYFKTDTQNPYQEINWGRFQGTCETALAPKESYGDEFPGCDYTVPATEIPTFGEIPFPFQNIFDNTKSLPLMASALIDIDNDGIDEVFVAGGVTQEDALFRYSLTGFSDISSAVALPSKPAQTTTFGATSFDLDKDGYTDLLLSGDYGLLWYKNLGGKFDLLKISITLNEKSTAATTTIGDFNKDGHADIFLCTYLPLEKMEGQTIFKDQNYGSTSILLQNNGDQTFTDVTQEVGLDYVHNTFQAVFTDVDNDGFIDLVVAYDTGEARTYKNMDGAHFQLIPNPLTGKYAYPMGIAVGDYNNDGNTDFFFSNTGSSVPDFLARGDLAPEDSFTSKWIMFRNDGNFVFTDVANEVDIAEFEFSWGAIFQDFNLDGLQDLVVAENYVDFPPHQLFKLPCRFLIQRTNGLFAAVEEQAGVINKHYAITPLTSDFNLDGYPDLIYLNLNGPIRAYLNAGGDHHYFAIRFPETADYAGTHVFLQSPQRPLLSDVYVVGEGLGSDQTAVLTFGLETETQVSSVRIVFPSGEEKILDNPEIDKVHFVEK